MKEDKLKKSGLEEAIRFVEKRYGYSPIQKMEEHLKVASRQDMRKLLIILINIVGLVNLKHEYKDEGERLVIHSAVIDLLLKANKGEVEVSTAAFVDTIGNA